MRTLKYLVPLVLIAIQSAGATPLGVRDDVPTQTDTQRSPEARLSRSGSIAPTQTEILQFALTLEHLENAYYSKYLAQFDEAAFRRAGFPDYVRGRMAQIGAHEKTHVKFLTDALRSDSVAPCTYEFPVNDPRSFVALSMILEGTGVSAYAGAVEYLTDPDVISAAATILSTEARQAAWVSSAVLKGAPWSGAFDTPLNGDQVISLASSFTKSCPSSNPQLPFRPFPKLTVSGKPKPGQRIKLAYRYYGSGARYLALFTGLDTIFVQIDADNMVRIPRGLQGIVYAVVSSDGTTVADDTTIAGPIILNFPFLSSASNAHVTRQLSLIEDEVCIKGHCPS